MPPQARSPAQPSRGAALRQVARLLVVLVIAVLMTPAHRAQQNSTAKISFDLPSDAAERSLKQFSARSGLEVLFASESAANVRTNAIKGDYTPRDAINRMLAGTKLAAVHELKTGAIRIVSVANASGRNQSADASPDSQPPTKKKASKP